MIKLSVERLKRLPLVQEEIWQGGWRSLTELKFGDGTSGRDSMLGIWATVDSGFFGPAQDTLHTRDMATHDKLLDLLASFATTHPELGYCPGQLQVTDPELARYLETELAETEIQVTVVDNMPAWEDVTEDFVAHLLKGPGGSIPFSLLANPQLDIGQILSFGEAAAEFYQAAQWRTFCDTDLIKVINPDAPDGLQYCLFMGWSRIEFGLSFYGHQEQFEKIQQGYDPREAMGDGDPVRFLSYNNRRDPGYRDLCREWASQGMPLASEDAFPVYFTVNPQTGPIPVGPQELEYVTGLLLALARTRIKDADQGRWSQTVPVGDRLVPYELELTYVVDPPNLADMARLHMDIDPRAHEGMFEAVHRAVGKEFNLKEGLPDESTLNSLNQRLAGMSEEELLEKADFPDSPEQRAKVICQSAYETFGYLRQIKARQALEINPHCLRALEILSEETSDQDLAFQFLEQGLGVIRDTLDLASVAQENDDLEDLYNLPDHRPALRVMTKCAEALWGHGRVDEALALGLETNALSPSSSGNLRHLMMGELLVRNRHDEVRDLLDEWDPDFLEAEFQGQKPDQFSCMDLGGDAVFIPVVKIILMAAKTQDPEAGPQALRQELGRIKRLNRYLLPLLTKDKLPPAMALENFSPKGGFVAQKTAQALGRAWHKYPQLTELAGTGFGPGKTGGKKNKGKKGKKRR